MGRIDDIMKSSGGAIRAAVGTGKSPNAAPPGMSAADARPMPARLQGVTKSKNVAEIAVDRIQRDEDQPREEFENVGLERLAESLRTRGQLMPIRVRWDEGRGAYVIVAGERRWRAAVMAGMTTLTCVVHEAPATPDELLEIQLIENAVREDLRPVEQARAFRKLMTSRGWSGSQLARELAIDHSTVSRAIALLDLPAPVQEKVDVGDLPARTALEIGRLEDDAEKVEMAERAAASGLTSVEVAATVKARRLGKAKAEPGGRREFKYPDGAKVGVTLPPGLAGPAAYLEMLQRAVKDVRAELKQAGPGQAA